MVGGQVLSGALTFLFTDLVDSTLLWEQHETEMAEAVARHDAILGDAVARNSGTVVKFQGDGLMAAFDDPDDAVRAAVEGQRALRNEDWPIPLGVRMGLCTGPARESAGDYHGPVVNRAARTASAAHPGQILVASATAALVSAAALRALGDFRLKGLPPLGLFQVLDDGIEAEFPPLAEAEVRVVAVPVGELEAAHHAFAARRWDDAFTHLSAADEIAALGSGDLQRLAVAAYLTGREDESADAWARAHETCVGDGDPHRAAVCAFWLGFMLMMRGDESRGSAWLARAQRLVAERDSDCVAEGLLLVPEALGYLDGGDAAAAFGYFERAGAIGERFADLDLVAIGRLGRGQSLIAQGKIADGVGLLDEAMLSVVAGDVGPVVSGIVYCAVLLECRDISDIRRAREWTDALTKWCATQPDMVPYRGQCLVHRSEVLQMRGEWTSALDQARQACERLAGHPAIGEAYYQQAEMYRLRGEFTEADTSYRAASQWGRDPQPGLSLLRLGQGNVDAASASIRRVVDETTSVARRSSVLGACTEIMLAANDVANARAATDELAAAARDHDAPVLHAVAGQAEGAVLLAEGDAAGALGVLRRAWTTWREIGAPYEAARVRVLIGLACRALGDEETAELEFDAARHVFQGLEARLDLERLAAMSQKQSPLLPAGLTAREAEVLRLVAAGKTNHEIATVLVVSDHTVRRHLQNIFAKIGVSSRAAATTYAFQHHLV